MTETRIIFPSVACSLPVWPQIRLLSRRSVKHAEITFACCLRFAPRAQTSYTVSRDWAEPSHEHRRTIHFLRGHSVSASVLKTAANRKSPEIEKNTRRIVDLLTEIKNEEEEIRQGGGAKAIESQHKKGRLTARERIAKLIDPGSQFFELGIYAAFEMYEEWG